MNDNELEARIRSTLTGVAATLDAEAFTPKKSRSGLHSRRVQLLSAAVIAVAMVGTSFVWKSDKKNSEIALAAFAVPRELNEKDKEKLTDRCKTPVKTEFQSTNKQFAYNHIGEGFGVEAHPIYIDSRGPVSIAVYGGVSLMVICSEWNGQIEVSHIDFTSANRLSFPMAMPSDAAEPGFPSDIFLTKGELAFQKYSTFGYDGVIIRGGFETREVLEEFAMSVRSASESAIVSAVAVTTVAMKGMNTSNFAIWLPLTDAAIETDLLQKVVATDWRGDKHLLWSSNTSVDQNGVKVPSSATSTTLPIVQP